MYHNKMDLLAEIDDEMEEELRSLEDMKALYKKNNKRKNVVQRKNVVRLEGPKSYEDLPLQILPEILAQVPPKDLFENARLVCRAWRQVISSSAFIARFFFEGKDELLITSILKGNEKFQVKRMEMSDELECTLHDFGPRHMSRIRSSCNGLILANHPKETGLLQVLNPTMKIGVTLSRCPSHCPHKACGAALGFDPISKQYKVVHMYDDSHGFEIASPISSECIWRRVPGPWENSQERPFKIDSFSWFDPVLVSNGRFFHWFVASNKYIISMDITREISTRTDLPYVGHEMKSHKYSLFELGGFLALGYRLSDCQLDIWILEDFKKQTWFKKHSINTELVKYMVPEDPSLFPDSDNALPHISKLVPVASLNNEKVLVLKHDFCIYLHDMESRMLKKVKLKKKGASFVVHRSSLLHWCPEDAQLSLSGLVI